eukprot:UN17684
MLVHFSQRTKLISTRKVIGIVVLIFKSFFNEHAENRFT